MKLLRNIIASTLAVLLALLGASYLSTQYSLAAPDGGTVGTGTPASCTEAALRAAMGGGGSVNFSCGSNPYTITLSSALFITKSTSVDGGGKITLSGNYTVGVMVVSNVPLTLTNIALAYGRNIVGGCLTYLGLPSTSLTMVGVVMHDCHSIGLGFGVGGALSVIGGNLSMSNTQVLNNRADSHGGGIYIDGGSHILDHVSIIGNRTDFTYTNSGGGIYFTNTSGNPALLNIQNSHIDNNIFGYLGYGGGIAAFTSTLHLVNVSLNNNLGENAGLGGGLYLQGATANLDSVTLDGNSHLYAGGGIESEWSDLTMTDSDISHNVASSNGGGISTYKGSLDLVRVVVNGNTVDSDAGGIDLYDTPTSIEGGMIVNNVGGRDGGGINHYRNTLSLNNVTIDGNIAQTDEGDGGGIYNDPQGLGVLLISNSTLSHNVSSNHGGGIYNTRGSTAILTNTTLSANTAITGGGLYNEAFFSTDQAIITLTNVTLKDNRANAGGGLFNTNEPLNDVFVKNTILADSPTGGNCKGKPVSAAKYSLSTDLSCGLVGTGNVSNTPARLYPLGSYGGPTLTHLPLATSPAVNAVLGNDCPLADQRGVVRPQGLFCDMGAVERQPGDPTIVPWLWIPLIVR